MNLRALLAVNLAAIFAASATTPPAIGIAVANGPFRVDDSTVTGNATVFDGSAVETEAAASRVRLGSATRIELSTAARATVFRNRARLDRGLAELATASGYELEARGLRIAPSGKSALARVRLDGSRRVLVSALNGPVRVFSSSGVLVANVRPGAALSFVPQAQQERAFLMSGCLLRKAGHYLLVDQTTNVMVEVAGDTEALAKELGNRVQITATTEAQAKPAEGASSVVRMTALDEVGPGGCVAAATAIGAEPAAAPPPPVPAPAPKPVPPVKPVSGGGPSGAVIAGVAVAAGGAAIAGIVLGTRGGATKSP